MDSKKPNKCYMCGTCCRDFAVNLSKEQLEDVELKEFVELHGCKIDRKEGHIEIPLPCKNLTADNKCEIYAERPQICRNFDCKE